MTKFGLPLVLPSCGCLLVVACGGGAPADGTEESDRPGSAVAIETGAPSPQAGGIETPADSLVPSEDESALEPMPGGVLPPSSGRATPSVPVQPAQPSGGTTPVPASAPAPPATDANAILERAEQVYSDIRSMEADFVQQVYLPLLDSRQNSRGRIYHRSPDRLLMRFSEPQGDVIVADGRYFWMYYPSHDPRQVIRSPMSEGGQRVDLHREFLSNATDRFSATRTGAEPVGGRNAHALTLTPRGSSPYRRIRLWVDAQDYLVRRFEIVEQNDTERRLELSNLRTNVSLGDDLFRFIPPPGAEIFEP